MIIFQLFVSFLYAAAASISMAIVFIVVGLPFVLGGLLCRGIWRLIERVKK